MFSPLGRSTTSCCMRSLRAPILSSTLSFSSTAPVASPLPSFCSFTNSAIPVSCQPNHYSQVISRSRYPLKVGATQSMLVRKLSSADEGKREESEAEKKRSAQLSQVAEQLKYDLSQVLTAKIDFVNDPVYHDKIILEDNIRRQTFGGLLEYMKNCNVLKILTHVKFVFSRLNLGTVVINPDTGVIRIEWNITGMGMTRLGLRYVPDKLWRRENIDKTAPIWMAGVSKYFVDESGKVIKHVIDPLPEKA